MYFLQSCILDIGKENEFKIVFPCDVCSSVKNIYQIEEIVGIYRNSKQQFFHLLDEI